MRARTLFGRRLISFPTLTGAEQMKRFLNSIREKNFLALRGKLERSDELHRSEKPLREGENRYPQ
jgi:hypothetical protein